MGKFCTNCGSKLNGNEKFCINCGQEVTNSNNNQNIGNDVMWLHIQFQIQVS